MADERSQKLLDKALKIALDVARRPRLFDLQECPVCGRWMPKLVMTRRGIPACTGQDRVYGTMARRRTEVMERLFDLFRGVPWSRPFSVLRYPVRARQPGCCEQDPALRAAVERYCRAAAGLELADVEAA